MALPKSIFVKSTENNKYLCYTKEKGPCHARLRFSLDGDDDEKAEIQYFKFDVEEAKVEGMVHIRNCYNNKYLVRKSADSTLIVGEANEPEEDQSKWSCTLFKPVFADLVDEEGGFEPHDEPRKIRLLHIDQLGEQYTCMSTNAQGGDDDTSDLVVGNGDAKSFGTGDVFLVYDARSSVVLPKYIAVMGHNDLYCAITPKYGWNYLEFKTRDLGAPGVLNSTVSNPTQNTISITNEMTGKKWAVTGTFIIPDNAETGTYNSNRVTYRPTGLGGNEVALFSLWNERFAVIGTGSGMQFVLGSSATSISIPARFRIYEPVFNRVIKKFVYNLDDARLYNVTGISVFNDTRENHTPLVQTGSINVSYKRTQTMSWKDTVSVTNGVSSSWTFKIPYVGEFGIVIGKETTETREWGEETTTEEAVEYGDDLTIPPMTKMTLRIEATRVSYDIPFTCEVIDTLTDGRVVEYTKTDGLFVGSNGYNYHSRKITEPL